MSLVNGPLAGCVISPPIITGAVFSTLSVAFKQGAYLATRPRWGVPIFHTSATASALSIADST
eukprot:4658741-Pleurochrysis_carterae.AAC.3